MTHSSLSMASRKVTTPAARSRHQRIPRRPFIHRFTTTSTPSTPRRGGLLDRQPPCVSRRFQAIKGERFVRQDEREWYHQFHRSLLSLHRRQANAAEYGSLSFLRLVIGF